MQEVNGSTLALPASRESLHEILRQGAQKMLRQVIEAEVAEWIEQHAHVTDERGRRQVVRNGHLPERKIVTGVGEVAIEQPRVHDRRAAGDGERFNSKLLPLYLRKTKSIEELPICTSNGTRLSATCCCLWTYRCYRVHGSGTSVAARIGINKRGLM